MPTYGIRTKQYAGCAGSPYHSAIARLIPDCDPRHVEAFMRVEFSTLDELSPARFAVEAGRAADCARAAPGLAEQLAQTYGL